MDDKMVAFMSEIRQLLQAKPPPSFTNQPLQNPPQQVVSLFPPPRNPYPTAVSTMDITSRSEPTLHQPKLDIPTSDSHQILGWPSGTMFSRIKSKQESQLKGKSLLHAFAPDLVNKHLLISSLADSVVDTACADPKGADAAIVAAIWRWCHFYAAAFVLAMVLMLQKACHMARRWSGNRSPIFHYAIMTASNVAHKYEEIHDKRFKVKT
ncbi:hypothetical protein Nepgr_001094 [Nepenthes gracilis]|uniref:Uncharacterized protein n=1 Tax=Nepenthes gracilis TaxID=150966 RepID=A0AAD3RXH4_NEPGR|nr:hypothetical protein Nepgr_001094 [Nepenthes gracilis]